MYALRTFAAWGRVLAQAVCSPVGVVLIACGLTSSASGDGLMRDGLGAISAGRGGANLAFADNGAVLHDNPAGMVNMTASGMFDCSLDGLVVLADYADAENDLRSDLAAYPLGHVAFLQKAWDGRLAYGLGVFTPAGFGAEYDMVNSGVDPGRSHYEYMSFGALVRVLPGVAFQATDRLAVGATLGVAANHTEIEGPFYIQTGALAGVPTHFDMQATGAALAWSTGVQYQLSEATTLGAAYNSRNRFKLDGSASVTIAGLGTARYDLDAEFAWPQTLGVGVQHRLSPTQGVGLDLIWFDWSQAFDSLDVTMTDPRGNQIRDSFPLRWRDSLSVRLGFEQALFGSSTLRAGYVYHRNPVPAETLTPYIPGILEHSFSLGYGKRWSDHSLDFAYSYSCGSEQGIGESGLQGGDFHNSRMDVQAHWLMLTFVQYW